MAGIFGIFHLDGAPMTTTVLGQMAAPMAHRGPGGSSVWQGETIGLGHLAFPTTAAAVRGRQPYAARGGEVVVTADVRLDNRPDLLAQLGPLPDDVSDAHLIGAAYERWGADCVDHLDGAFAFALWDGQARRLLCVRDHLGVKPLYYAHVDGRLFAVASEPKAMLALEAVADDPDPVRVAEHLLAPVQPDPARTFYKAIRSIAPAEAVMVTPEAVRRRTYWTLDPERVLRLPSDEAYVEAFRELFEETVYCRMQSTRRVGTMLSGGMDSSSIACVAARIAEREGRGPLATYSAVFPAVPDSDESAFIQTVLDRYDVEPTLFPADEHGPLAHAEAMTWHQDGPIQGGNAYINWHLYRRAGQQGVGVVLDGFDGDTTLSHGIGLFFELLDQGAWFRLGRAVKAHAQRQGEPWLGATWQWLRVPLERRFGLGYVRSGLRRVSRARARWRAGHAGGEAITWTDLVDESLVTDVTRQRQPGGERPTTERAFHRYLLQRPLLAQANASLDALAAAAGVEVRFPFWDRRLVEFCLALPPEQKMRDGWTRFILRRSMEDVLPERIQWRTRKTSMAPSFDRGVRLHDRHRVEGLAEQAASVAPYLNAPSVRWLCARYLAGTSTPSENVLAWRTLSLALWAATRSPSNDLEFGGDAHSSSQAGLSTPALCSVNSPERYG